MPVNDAVVRCPVCKRVFNKPSDTWRDIGKYLDDELESRQIPVEHRLCGGAKCTHAIPTE